MDERTMKIQEILDRAEEAALKRAEEVAYHATERVEGRVQKAFYDNMKAFISTGVRLMREEIERDI